MVNFSKTKQYEKECSGAITIFLSLTICLILSLVSAMIETARVSAATIYSERVMLDAMQSVLADYYEPLYENYHVFALKQDDYDGLFYGEEMEKEIKKYANYSFDPAISKQLRVKEENFLLCKPSLKDVTITDYTTLLSYDGELFRKQAIAYMKYQILADATLSILDGFHLVKESETVTYLLNERVNVENKLARADALMLQLMETVEGICTDEYGVDYGIIKGLSHNDNFVKKFVSGHFVTMESVATNHEKIFNEMKGSYLDPQSVADTMTEYVEQYKIYREEYESAQAERDQIYQEYISFLQSLPQGEEGEGEGDGGEAGEEATENEGIIDAYEMQLSEYDTILDNISHSMRECIQMVTIEAGRLRDRNEALIEKIETAEQILGEIKALRTSAREEADTLEETYEEQKDRVSEEYYDGLMEGVQEIREYTSEAKSSFGIIKNVSLFEKALEEDKDILKSLNAGELSKIEHMTDASVQSSIDALANKYRNYEIEDLAFDYSGLILEKEENSIKETVKKLINSGLASLVMDTDSLADGELDQIYLPTNLMGIQEEEIQDEQQIKDTINQKEEGGRSFATLSESLFDADLYGDNIVEELAEDLLFLGYLDGHFTEYMSEQYKPSQTMQYELEYILFGKANDADNVKAMASKLILVRTLMNLVHVVTDAKKKSEAATFAASVVGFTGLSFLIAAVKYITLFIWAFEEALVEVSALIQEKKVVFLPTKDSFQVDFEELFKMTKEKIKTKGKEYKEKEQALSFNYDEYLKFFLYISNGSKQSYRAMDLIQANLQIEYEEGFLISNCVYGYEAECTLTMPQLFLRIPYVFNRELEQIEGYGYQISEGVSY